MSAKELHVYIFCQVGGRERERERTLPLSRSGPRTLSPLFSIRAASSRNPWVGQPACQPWETRGERVLSCEVSLPLSLFATLETLEFVSTESKFDRFHFVEILVENPPTCGSESCVFILLFFNFKLSRTIRYDTIRYEFRFIPLSSILS